jgi:hypothetical protein
MIVLNAGVTFDDFESSGFDESLVAAVGSADRSGKYQTSPQIARGVSYTVVIGAKGYEPRVFEEGLEITDSDPDVVDVEDIAIQRQ